MERLGILLCVCSLALLTEQAFAGLLPNPETLGNAGQAHGTAIAENHPADSLKSKNAGNDSECLASNHTKDAAWDREEFIKKPSSSNKLLDASEVSAVDISSSHVEDAQHPGHDGGHDTAAANCRQGPAASLSSHDILLDPTGLMPVRSARQIGKSDAKAYARPISEGTFGDAGRSSGIDLSRDSNREDDLGAAEDRYRDQYPYWYRRQFPNQRYPTADRREPYRNYLRYPVFPGR